MILLCFYNDLIPYLGHNNKIIRIIIQHFTDGPPFMSCRNGQFRFSTLIRKFNNSGFDSDFRIRSGGLRKGQYTTSKITFGSGSKGQSTLIKERFYFPEQKSSVYRLPVQQ